MSIATATITYEYKPEFRDNTTSKTTHSFYTNALTSIPGTIIKVETIKLSRTIRKVIFWNGKCDEVNQLLKWQKEHNEFTQVRIDLIINIISNCKNGAW